MAAAAAGSEEGPPPCPIDGSGSEGRTARLAGCLLGYLCSDENAVALLSKSHPVLAKLGLQRLIIAYLASGRRHLAVVAGSEGCGKSFLLAEVERRAREVLPLLSIYGSYAPGAGAAAASAGTADGRGRAVALLREVWRVHGGSDEEFAPLSPNEILHNGPSLLRRACERAAGIILLLDDLPSMCFGSLPNWLPTPLPPGLHCIATATTECLGVVSTNGTVVRTLGPPSPAERRRLVPPRCSPPLPAEDQAEEVLAALGRLESEGHAVGPRTCCLLAHLASLQPGTWQEKLEMAAKMPWDVQAALALAILRVCAERWDRLTLWTAALLAHTSLGLGLVELTALCQKAAEAGGAWAGQCIKGLATADLARVLEVCAPLLYREHVSTDAFPGTPPVLRCRLAGGFAHRACEALCREAGLAGDCVRRLLAAHFAAAAAPAEEGPGGANGQDIDEAAAQLACLDLQEDKAGRLLADFATRPDVLAHFSTRGDELIALWRRMDGGCAAMGAQLLAQAAAARSPARQRIQAGRLLSVAGEFAAARELLQQACELLAEGAAGDERRERARAEALTILAHNEVRYWDSRRNWGSTEPLRLLLESSSAALALLRRRPAEGLADRHLLARALSRRANGCFKAGCVTAPGSREQTAFFDEASLCVAEAVGLLGGLHAQVAGQAVLVGGVTTMCRAHSLEARGLQAEHHAMTLKAMGEFYQAEAILRASVGPICEESIYTHGNLAELYMRDLREFFLGLLHFRQSCIVAVRVFGPEHANARGKLRELEDIFRRLSWGDFEEAVRQGRPESLQPTILGERLGQRLGRQWHRGPHSADVAAELARLRGEAAAPGFWAGVWGDLGLYRGHHVRVACGA